MSLIQKLERLMDAKRINRSDLSRQAQIPYSTVDGFWQKGTDNIKRSTLLKLSNYFGCTLDYLADDRIPIDFEERNTRAKRNTATVDGIVLSSSEREIILKYRSLDERGKEAVDETLDREYSYAFPSVEDTYGEVSESC